MRFGSALEQPRAPTPTRPLHSPSGRTLRRKSTGGGARASPNDAPPKYSLRRKSAWPDDGRNRDMPAHDRVRINAGCGHHPPGRDARDRSQPARGGRGRRAIRRRDGSPSPRPPRVQGRSGALRGTHPLDEDERLAAIEQSLEEKQEELRRRRHHYEEIRGQLQRERTRILDRLLPARFAMAGSAQVFPVAVEIRLPEQRA